MPEVMLGQTPPLPERSPALIAAAAAAARQIFTPPFRAAFWKSIGLTLLLLAVLWLIIEHLVVAYVHFPWHWLSTVVEVLAGAGLAVGAFFLITPVAFVVAGFFFDELADRVESEIAGPSGRGRALPLGPALWIGVRFGALSLFVNAVALLLLLVPGVNVIAFFCANAYLYGRGFFELAALRYRTMPEVRALGRTHATRLFLAGCLPAALSLVPIVNLLTPLYATALLVRVTRPLVAAQPLQEA
jgi:CysZ protein